MKRRQDINWPGSKKWATLQKGYCLGIVLVILLGLAGFDRQVPVIFRHQPIKRNQALASLPGETSRIETLTQTTGLLTYLPIVNGITRNYSLTIWHGLNDSQAAAYQQVMADYHQLHPNVSITMQKQDDLYGAIKTAVPLGSGPDIAIGPNDWIGDLVENNLIVTIDPYLPADYLVNTFEPAAANGVIYKTQGWAIPDTQEGIALVYNKSVITSTELPNPTDFNDLLTKATQYQLSHPGKTYLCNQGLGGTDSYHVAPIYFGHGLNNYGGYVDENGVAYLDTAEALAAANWINSFRPYGTPNGEYSICQNGLIAGSIAIWWTGPWALPEINNSGIYYGIAPMGNPFVGIKGYLVTTNAISRGNAPALYDLLQYFGSPEVQKQITLANSTIPANTQSLNDPAVQANYNIKQFGLALHAGVPMGNSKYAACQWVPVGDETLNVWIGFKTPANAMADAQAAIETCISGLP